jgi:bacterioferritin
MPKSNKAAKSSAGHGELLERLDRVLQWEISGVVRYLHYSFMVRGPNRIPIVNFFRSQANESFTHATTIGEKISSLGGHPSLKVSPVPETGRHGVLDILKESLEFERSGVEMYIDLLPLCGDNIALEEMVREFVRMETEHIEEVEKMIETVK